MAPDAERHGSGSGTLFGLFPERSRAAGTEVYRASSRTAARQLLVDIIRKLGGVPLVALDCPGFAVQIKGALDIDGVGAEVRHTAEILAGHLKETRHGI